MEKMKLKGHFTGVLRHKDGSVEVRRKDNLILDVGFDFIADAIGNAAKRPDCMGFTAVGTGTTETAANQTGLAAERHVPRSCRVRCHQQRQGRYVRIQLPVYAGMMR